MTKIFQFESKYRTQFIWSIRFLIAFLFVLSAVAKLMPIELFEKQLVDISNKPGPIHGFTNWCGVTVWSRTIIIAELFLGLSLLIPFYQRTVTIPLSIAMLLVFIMHLSYQIMVFGNAGNCGCMGELLPMSPFSAIVKNILTIVLLIYLFFVGKKLENEIPTIHFLLLPAIIFSIFLFNPIKKSCCCEDEIEKRVSQESKVLNDRIEYLNSSLKQLSNTTGDSIPVPVSPPEPPPKISEFHDFKRFNLNGSKVSAELDKGKNIVCVFNPDCDHCKDLAKKLKTLKNKNFADIHFLFYNPDAADANELENQIQAFLKEVGISVMWNSLDINAYVRLLENAPAPPRLVILENGKIIYDYLGDGEVDLAKVKRLGQK
jgi:uncharacterized membrane protein YphA (DoxX/SURF4 family)